VLVDPKAPNPDSSIDVHDSLTQRLHAWRQLHEKPSALKIEHQSLTITFFLFLLVIFALLDPDPGTRLNLDPIRIRIHNTAAGQYSYFHRKQQTLVFYKLPKYEVTTPADRMLSLLQNF
jgi:hypothetical protein